jgi:hypothetical protein
MNTKLDKVLLAYTLAVGVGLSAFGATQAISDTKTTAIHTVDVQRINVREPDGTLRMVIANTDRMPGLYVKGKEWKHPTRQGAGVLFFNDEGTENGGFGFSGSKSKDGTVSGGGNLSFDQYEQDQVLVLMQNEYAGRRSAGLQVNDRPDHPMDIALFTRVGAMPDGPAKTAEMKKLIDAGEGGANRLFIGKADKTSAVVLKDAKGRTRLSLTVDATGASAIKFLDADGKVTRTLAP